MNTVLLEIVPFETLEFVDQLNKDENWFSANIDETNNTLLF